MSDPIQSIRQTLAGGYRKPEPGLVDNYITDLSNCQEALDYLKVKRGFTDETIKHFKLGYNKDRHAISIPVYKKDELVNIRYRSLDPEAKCKYTQERGCEVWLYNDEGIERGKAKKGVLIVEGEFDLMSVWQAGFKNVVSPSSGKDSYGPWVELLDAIPYVYIAYDNDAAGKTAALRMAERVGIDKCYEVLYSDDVKDANDYFLSHNADEFRQILQAGKDRPFYKHQFAGIGDIIDGLREQGEEQLKLDTIPFVEMGNDWMIMLSADSNGGKTTYALNVANELVNKEIPTLVFPFERGLKMVGPRYLQVRYNKQAQDLHTMVESEIDIMKKDCVNLPLYFSKPEKEQFFDVVRRAKRLFGIRVIVVDHLDFFVSGKDRYSQQADFCKEVKLFCEEIGVICIMIHHIGKDKDSRRRGSKLTKEDLKGASDLYQIPEVVILLYPDHEPGYVVIAVDKNKGTEGRRKCKVDMSTGVFGSFEDVSAEESARREANIENEWQQTD